MNYADPDGLDRILITSGLCQSTVPGYEGPVEIIGFCTIIRKIYEKAMPKAPNPKQPGPGQGGHPRPDCPLLPKLPSGIGTDQIEKDIKEAHSFYDAALATDPESALAQLFGFFIARFQPGGDWDYKKDYANGTADQVNARILGNFNFGAVLQSFDFSYRFTQSAAGIAQKAICAGGCSCGQGIPGLVYPYGDQPSDAADIRRGYDYEAAKRANCK